MSIGLLAFLAFIPILIALILMAGLRWPSTRAMPIAWLAGVVLPVPSGVRIRCAWWPFPSKVPSRLWAC